MTTRSGHTVQPPMRLIEEMGATSQVAGIGPGIGGGFENTNELKVMTYQEAMNSKDQVKWRKAVEEEHERMIKNKVWKPVDRSTLPEDAQNCVLLRIFAQFIKYLSETLIKLRF